MLSEGRHAVLRGSGAAAHGVGNAVGSILGGIARGGGELEKLASAASSVAAMFVVTLIAAFVLALITFITFAAAFWSNVASDTGQTWAFQGAKLAAQVLTFANVW